DHTINGVLLGAIAYPQTGGCRFNGEACTLVELSLRNGFRSADLSLIPPSVEIFVEIQKTLTNFLL
ncbi:hypothetical protein C8F04DRAFT_954165, partial [Mycena alexandri]